MKNKYILAGFTTALIVIGVSIYKMHVNGSHADDKLTQLETVDGKSKNRLTKNIALSATAQFEKDIANEPLAELLVEEEPTTKLTIENIETDPVDLQSLNFENLVSFVQPNTEESKALHAAEQASIEQCMNEQGHEYSRNEYDQYTENHELDLTDPVEVNTQGYGIWNHVSYGVQFDTAETVNMNHISSPPIDNNTNHLAGLTAQQQREWDEAFIGKLDFNEPSQSEGSIIQIETPNMETISWDSSSCVSASRRAVYGDDIEYRRELIEIETLNEKLAIEIQNDPEFQSSLHSWRECMLANGYEYEYPGQAGERLLEQFSNGEISIEALQSTEIQIASTDSKCYIQSDVGSMLTSVKARAGEAIWAANKDQIIKLRLSLQNAVKTAAMLQQ